MDTSEDFVTEQDPDYATPGPSNSIQQQKLYEKTARTNTSRKINAIIEKEFTREIDNKENEILVIQNRLNQALKTLHLLRYVIITDFYNRKQCISEPQPKVNDSKQTRIHPAIKQVINQAPTSLSASSSSISTATTNHNNDRNKNQLPTLEAAEFQCPKTARINENEQQKNDNEQPKNDPSVNNDNSNSKKRHLDPQEGNSDGPLKKIPRHIPPKYGGPQPRLPSRGDRHKIIKRIVVGNISKWIPPDWRDDDASHKWTMYVRGSKEDAKIDDFIAKIRFFLHPSYRPNDVVEVTSPPFHLSRRGWGEFPLRVQLHFKNSSNKPMDIIHNLKLDRTYTGLQTLGSETIVDVWINTQDSAQQSQQQISEFIKEERINVDVELDEQENNVTIAETSSHDENKVMPHHYALMDHDYINFYQFKSNNSKSEEEHSDDDKIDKPTEVDNSSEIKNGNVHCSNVKMNKMGNKLKPLEIIIPPRFSCLKTQKPLSNLSSQKTVKQILVLNEKQTIPVNILENNSKSASVPKSAGISLLKFKLNPAKSLLLEANSNIPALQIANPSARGNEKTPLKVKIAVGKDKVRITTKRDYYENILNVINDVKITDMESLLRFIVKRIPIIHENASDPEYRRIHPYVCPSEKEFMDCNVGKQRALEWYRAKAVHSYLRDKSPSNDQLWTVKEIMVWCRLHGYTPPVSSPIFMPATPSTSATTTVTTSQSASVSSKKMPGDKCETFLFNTNTAPTPLVTWQKNSALQSSESYQVDELIDVVDLDQDDITRRNHIDRLGGTDQNGKKDLVVIQVPKNILPFYSFVCNTARVIGIRIVPEELEPGISDCVAARLIVKSLQCLLEDLLRSSLAKASERNSRNGSCPDAIMLDDVRGALLHRDEFDIFTNFGLMYVPPQHQAISDHN